MQGHTRNVVVQDRLLLTDEVSSFAPVGFDTTNSVDPPLADLLDDHDFFASQFSLFHELHDDTLIMKSTMAEL